MTLIPFWHPAKGQLQVGGLMSGTGKNLEAAIRLEHSFVMRGQVPPFHIAVIYTNKPHESRAYEIGDRYMIPAFGHDYKLECQKAGVPTRDMAFRQEYEKKIVKIFNSFGVSFAAYGGWMLIATADLVNAFPGVNVHPADLTIYDENGYRKYTGDDAVAKALLAGEKTIRSTTHIMTEKVDDGPVLLISRPLLTKLPSDWDPRNPEIVKRVASEHQGRLKDIGDLDIFPRTILDWSLGKLGRDSLTGLVHYDGKAIPYGYKVA